MPSFLSDQLSYLVNNIIDNHRKNSCCVPKPPGGSVVKVSRQCKGGKPSGADTEQRMRHQQVGSRPIYLSLRPRPWCKAHKRSRPCRRTGMLLHAIPRTPGKPANHLERIRFTTGSLLLLQKIECRLILLFDRYFQVVVLQLCIALCTWRILPCRTNLLLLHPIPPTPGNPVHNVQNILSPLPVTPQDRDTCTVHWTQLTIV